MLKLILFVIEAKMPIFVSREKNLKILFVHIPKTGGGSIEKFFRAHDFEVDLFSSDPALVSCLKCSPQHMHASMLESLLNLGAIDYIFTVMRHPVNRIISEYKWRIMHPWSVNGFDPWYQRVRSERTTNPYLFDNHLRPQAEFLLPKIRVFPFELGLARVLEQVSKHLSLNFDLSKLVNQKLNRRLRLIQHDPKLLSLYSNASISLQSKRLIFGDYAQDFRIFDKLLEARDDSLHYGRSGEFG